MQNVIKLRGTKDGFLLNVKDLTSFNDFFASFKELVLSSPQVFEGGRIAGINGIRLGPLEQRLLTEFAQEMKIAVLSFDALSEKKKQSCKVHYEPDIQEEAKYKADDTRVPVDAGVDAVFADLLADEEQMKDTLFYRGTVRSGVKLESDKHIVIVGDVNPGASLVAGGNVVVLGILRGFAHAGAFGDDKAMVCAWKFKPTQIRIADFITMPPDDAEDEIAYPEVALVEDGRMIIKSYL